MSVRTDGREQRLRAVKSAAWSLFVAHGFEATTVRQIAAEAGVSTGTVMSFGSKGALLLELFDDAIADRIGTEPSPSDDPTEAVWACYRPYFEFFDSQPVLARAYASVLFSGTERQPAALGENAAQFNAYVAHVIAEKYPDAGIEDARCAADAIFATYMHVLMRWANELDDADGAVAAFERQLTWQLSRFNQK